MSSNTLWRINDKLLINNDGVLPYDNYCCCAKCQSCKDGTTPTTLTAVITGFYDGYQPNSYLDCACSFQNGTWVCQRDPLKMPTGLLGDPCHYSKYLGKLCNEPESTVYLFLEMQIFTGGTDVFIDVWILGYFNADGPLGNPPDPYTTFNQIYFSASTDTLGTSPIDCVAVIQNIPVITPPTCGDCDCSFVTVTISAQGNSLPFMEQPKPNQPPEPRKTTTEEQRAAIHAAAQKFEAVKTRVRQKIVDGLPADLAKDIMNNNCGCNVHALAKRIVKYEAESADKPNPAVLNTSTENTNLNQS